MTVNQGDNSNFQMGTNVANSKGNIAAGDDNVVVGASMACIAELDKRKSNGIRYSNVIAGIGAGLLAGWWCCPDGFALGPTRLIVTVTLVIGAAVMSLMGWFQFRRRNWEKFAYITLGSILILRSAIPTLKSWIIGQGSLGDISLDGQIEGYLSFADEPIWASIQIFAAVVILSFAFRTKAASE